MLGFRVEELFVKALRSALELARISWSNSAYCVQENVSGHAHYVMQDPPTSGLVVQNENLCTAGYISDKAWGRRRCLMCGLTIRRSLYTTLLGRNKLRKSVGRKERKEKERTKETKKVEHDFVLNVSLSFVSFWDVSIMCSSTSSFVSFWDVSIMCSSTSSFVLFFGFFLLMTVYLTFVTILFYLRNYVFVCTRLCVSLILRLRRYALDQSCNVTLTF